MAAPPSAAALVPGVEFAGPSDTGLIPALGFGVGTAWLRSAGSRREQALTAAVEAALDAGFRHIDEAEMYGNEGATGKTIQGWLKRTDTPRESLFITSKIISVDAGIEKVCRRSLAAMRCGYFDLYLVHAPCTNFGAPFRTSLPEIWRQMEALVDHGLVRAIGVSNWRIADLRQIVDSARIQPSVNQLEAHPYLQQPALLNWCSARRILVTAYSPLASLTTLRGGPVDEPVTAAAQAHDATAAQVLMRWSLQTGRLPITTTSKRDRLVEYLGIFDFELSMEEIAAISAAGAKSPHRTHWTQCGTVFHANPRHEEDTRGVA